MVLRLKMALCVALALVCSCSRSPQTTSDKYRSGQVWRYKTRTTEQTSRLTVLNVERNRSGEEVVFVAINNLHIAAPSGELTSVSSVPFARQALDGSVTELEETAELTIPTTADVVGPTPTEWRRANGEPIRVSVADYVNTLTKWPQTKFDAPLKPPLSR